MNIFDQAQSISTMMSMRGATQGQIAKMLGVSQPYIANKLRLLSYSDTCRKKIIEYGLSERHARAILKLKEESARLDTIDAVHERRLTVSECEGLVDMLHETDLAHYARCDPPTKRLDKFVENLELYVRNLRSLGFDISKKTSYIGGVMYITLSVSGKHIHDNF